MPSSLNFDSVQSITRLIILFRMARTFSWLCGPVLIASTSFAQPPPPDSIVTWPACVSLALKHNPELASSRYALEASKSAYLGSFNGLLPQPSLGEGYGSSRSAANPSGWQAQAGINVNLLSMSEITNIQI